MYGVNGMGYQMPYQPYQANQSSLPRVNGIEGAKAYQLGANSTIALFDSNADIFYIKSVDNAGFPNIRVFSFEEMGNSQQSETMSRKEIEEYVKHLVSEYTNTTATNATNQSTAIADGQVNVK